MGAATCFYAYVEYATSRCGGADSPGGFALIEDPERPGRKQFAGFASKGTVHTWSLEYDPDANGGQGGIIATIDDQKAVCHLDPGHKEDGAIFNRFGLLSIPKSYDQGGEIWLDDIDVNGEREDFATDPKWDAVGNRRTYMTYSVRPRFDFGFSDTNFAAARGAASLAALFFGVTIAIRIKSRTTAIDLSADARQIDSRRGQGCDAARHQRQHVADRLLSFEEKRRCLGQPVVRMAD